VKAFKISQIEASILEVETDKEGKKSHVKHIALGITHPAICAAVQAAIAKALAEEQDAAGIKDADQFTLDNCEDASRFELTGKKELQEAEVKALLANKKKEEKKKGAA
jgi:hypothetical protein